MARELDKHPHGWVAPGNWLVLLTALISVLLWLSAQSSIEAVTEQPLIALARLSGVVGLTLYAVNVLLSMRTSLLEKLFGGLNRVYRAHHSLGGLAFIFMLSHPLLIILGRWSQLALLELYFIPSPQGIKEGYGAGAIALWTTIVLLSITYWMKIPYHWWKLTHTLMGIPAIFLIVHVLLVPSSVNRSAPLRYWLLGLLVLALLARVYRVTWLRFLKKGLKYEISQINLLGPVTEVTAKPTRRALKYLPGQFAFISFLSQNVPAEQHPFTISTYSNDGTVRFSMKNSGDYTQKLSQLSLRDKIQIQGPYGVFGHSVYETSADLVFVAGGIGITPFLSLLRWLNLHQPQRKVVLLYSVKTSEEAVYLSEIKTFKKSMKNLKIVLVETDRQGVVTAEYIIEQSGAVLRQRFLICGPPMMQHALTKQLSQQGVKHLRIETELFSL